MLAVSLPALLLGRTVAAQGGPAPAAPPAPGAPAAASAAPTAFALTIPNIMRGPELYGREPQNVRWSPDGRWLYFQWLPPGTAWREPLRTYRVRAEAGARPERVSIAGLDSVAPGLAPGRLSPDRRQRAVASNGDLYLVDLRAGTSRRLTQTPAVESSPSFGADGRTLYYVRDNNVFALTLAGPSAGFTRQLTDVRAADAAAGRPTGAAGGAAGTGAAGGIAARGAGRDTARSGQRGTLAAEQRRLLEVVRDRLYQDSVIAAERGDTLAAAPPRVALLPGERVTTLAPSPDGTALVMATTLPAEGARNIVVPDYVTASGYVEEIPGRSKVGDAQAAGRLLFLDLKPRPATTAPVVGAARPAAPGPLRVLRAVPLGPGAPARDSVLPLPQAAVLGWNASGSHALVLAVTRDFKRRYLSTVSADSGTVRVVDELRDTAWVGGPCARCAGWYDGGRRIWFVSEADGWAHLYTVAADGSDRRQLTRGAWEVTAVELAPDERSFVLTTSETSPFEQHVWRMGVDGGPRVRLTARPGGHTAVLSPDGRRFADVFSQANRPPELFVQDARPGATPAQLTVSPTVEWLAQPWLKPAIVRIPASDGAQVPARIYRPSDVGATPNGAAVIFVHGAGYLHNVHDWWSTYAREYMFHHYLARKGYVVLDLDYRASAGYGRDWRTAIYRHMGGRDLQDHVDAVRWLNAAHGVPASRVGIYGGSYGGFITLMALFTAPDHFGAGAALRAVTNWAHYNHQYTGAILNLPQDDSVAYRRSSPIYHAEGLRAPLLMAHGMVDVNVHFQDIVELTQRLIELGKTDWTLAPYPVEDHGFVRPSSWADEYRRIDELFDRVLLGRTTSVGSR